VVVSVDGLEDTKQTQEKFPNLLVLSDEEKRLTKILNAIHPGAGPKGDIAAPTTFLVRGDGQIVWTFRPTRHIERVSVEDLLAAMDEHLPPWSGNAQ
jgi:peroxiredoxin